MPLRVECPAGHKLIVPDDRAGRTLRCPRCQAAFVAPGERVQGSAFRVQEEQVAVPELAASIQPSVALVVVPATCEPIAPPLPLARDAEPVVKPKSRHRPPPPVPVEQRVQGSGFGVQEEQATQVEIAPRVEPPAVEPPPAVAAVDLVVPEPPPVCAEVRTAPEPPAPIPEVLETLPEKRPESLATESAIEAVATEIVARDLESASEPAAPVTRADEPESAPDAVPQAITPDRHWLPAAYGLAAGLIAAALFGMAPAVWDIVEYVRYYDEATAPHVARWALVLLLLGALQAAYAVYLFQLPDWTSVWVVTLYALGLAGLYALLLGLFLISREDGLLVGPHGLQLADKLAGGKAALWCLAMTCVSILLAFFAGRLSHQWRRSELVLRAAAIQSE